MKLKTFNKAILLFLILTLLLVQLNLSVIAIDNTLDEAQTEQEEAGDCCALAGFEGELGELEPMMAMSSSMDWDYLAGTPSWDTPDWLNGIMYSIAETATQTALYGGMLDFVFFAGLGAYSTWYYVAQVRTYANTQYKSYRYFYRSSSGATFHCK